jgi:hypothetical protein
MQALHLPFSPNAWHFERDCSSRDAEVLVRDILKEVQPQSDTVSPSLLSTPNWPGNEPLQA